MNNVCVCVGKYANKPFYVKFSEISLYSMEELCYYFIESIYVLDADIMCMELVEWIRTECGLEELADELETYVRKRVSLVIFVTTILEQTGIYDQTVIKKVEQVLRQQIALTPYERWKRRADQYYQRGYFRQAQDIFFQLLEELPEGNREDKAILYYNIAGSYAMDFAYDKAAIYYWKSYQLRPAGEIRRSYLLAVRKSLTDFEYGTFMREHEEWKEDFDEAEKLCRQAQAAWETSKTKQVVEEWKACKSTGQIGEYYERRAKLMKNLKSDYRKQTM